MMFDVTEIRVRRRTFRVAATMATLATLVGSCGKDASSAPCPPSIYRSTTTLIIAHAGGDFFGPPNTIEMMRAAKVAGADILDADVRVTKDGVLVAAHDDLVTTRSGQSVSIAGATYADLRLIDLGDSWAGPTGNYPLTGTGVSVPTIEAVMNAFPDNRVGLEFKVDGAEDAMCSLLRTLNRTSDAFISSGGDGPNTRFKSVCPEAVTTVTNATEREYLQAEATGAPWCAPVGIAQPPLVDRGVALTKDNVQWDHDHGLADYTYTADTETVLRAVARLGVDAVYTDRPDLARAILRR